MSGVQLDFLVGGLTDGNGDPYDSVTVEFYVAGTSTPLEVFANSNLTGSLGTSVDLDAFGRALVFYDGNNRVKTIIKDPNGDVTFDGLAYGTGSGTGGGALQADGSVPMTGALNANGQDIANANIVTLGNQMVIKVGGTWNPNASDLIAMGGTAGFWSFRANSAFTLHDDGTTRLTIDSSGNMTLTGALQVSGQITGVTAGSAAGHAVEWQQWQDSVTLAGGNAIQKDGSVGMEANLNMGTNRIINLEEVPLANGDLSAATVNQVYDVDVKTNTAQSTANAAQTAATTAQTTADSAQTTATTAQTTATSAQTTATSAQSAATSAVSTANAAQATAVAAQDAAQEAASGGTVVFIGPSPGTGDGSGSDASNRASWTGTVIDGLVDSDGQFKAGSNLRLNFAAGGYRNRSGGSPFGGYYSSESRPVIGAKIHMELEDPNGVYNFPSFFLDSCFLTFSTGATTGDEAQVRFAGESIRSAHFYGCVVCTSNTETVTFFLDQGTTSDDFEFERCVLSGIRIDGNSSTQNLFIRNCSGSVTGIQMDNVSIDETSSIELAGSSLGLTVGGVSTVDFALASSTTVFNMSGASTFRGVSLGGGGVLEIFSINQMSNFFLIGTLDLTGITGQNVVTRGSKAYVDGLNGTAPTVSLGGEFLEY